MDNASTILYGGFPRTVASSTNGALRQHCVHSESEFDLWFQKLRPDRNLYSSTCRFREDMRPILDEVFFDFDSPMKEAAFDSGVSDREKIGRMRDDEELADEILGEVWSDAQSLVEACLEDSVPALAVFSGLGLHVHMLYQDRTDPVEEKVSITNYYVDECDLTTWDRQVRTDTRRVLRVPNSQRIDKGEPTGVWCIPITENELLNNTHHDLLERCSSPKDIEYKDRYLYKNRPEMELIEGYEEIEEDSGGTVPLNEIDSGIPDDVEEIVREFIPLPCVRERFLSSNPHHMIRFNGAVLLYQAGFTPTEVREIIRKIGWIDYDKDITYKMTESIWNGRYSENSCSKLQSLGLCVQGPDFEEFGDEPSDCETYKWISGDCLW